MKKTKIAMLVFSVAILFGILLFLNPAKIIEALSKADVFLLLAAFFVTNMAVVFRILKWKVLLKDIKFSQAAPVQLFGITISNLTPGKLGEPVKSLALKMLTGVPVSHSLPTVIWERIMDILVMIIFGMIGAYFILPSSFMLIAEIAMALFLCIILVMLFVLMSQQFGKRAFALLKKLPVLNKISDDFITSFYSSHKIPKRNFAACFILTFLAWLFDGIVFYMVFLAITHSGFDIAFPAVMTCILSLSVLIGLLSSLPGGVGGTEAVMILLLTVIGMPAAVAGTVVLLGRLLTFGYSIILGYIAFLWLGKKIDTNEIMKAIGF